MKRVLYHLIIIILFFSLITEFSPAIDAATPIPSGGYWYRGSVHNHVSRYGGTPAEFRDRYRNAGYDFLVWTEHDYDNPPPCSEQEALSVSGFLVLCGVEISTNNGHFGAFALDELVNASGVQEAVDKVLNNNGVPIKNHPISDNFSATEIINTVNLNHFEVANGNRLGQTSAAETLWDSVLSATNGRPIFAVGSDDNHGGTWENAWIVVRANALNKQEIRENFRNGNFYTSTGVNLSDYQVDHSAKTIFISTSNGNNIQFIGKNGALLRTVSGSQATYTYTGAAAEMYIRAKVTNSAGKAAWTQPVYFTGGSGPTATPTSGCAGQGDVNCNGTVDVADLRLVLKAWGTNTTSREDAHQDGKVNLYDAAVVISNWAP